MLINTSSNEAAARFRDADEPSELNVKDSKVKIDLIERSHDCCSVSEQYRMANKMKETTAVGEQFLSAQNACWCHLLQQQERQLTCVNCQRAAAAAATATTMATSTTMTTRVTALGSTEGVIESDNEVGDGERDDNDRTDSNCDSDAVDVDNYTDNEDGARSANDSETVRRNVFNDNEVTTVLNGATFSEIVKNIHNTNIFNNNKNDNASDTNDCKETFASAAVNKDYANCYW
uniref:Uncharacterized protein n=1 Tax=Ceratitis capitata TaxID=7213 RepID=W8BAJ8_CERCA